MILFRKTGIPQFIFVFGFISIFFSCQSDKDDAFYVKEFVNYREPYFPNKDSTILIKRFLINDPYDSRDSLNAALEKWSRSNLKTSIFQNSKTKVLYYYFYEYKSGDFWEERVDEFYETSGGVFSKGFGDENNPLYIEMEIRLLSKMGKIRQLIYLRDRPKSIKLSLNYYEIPEQ